MQSVPLSRAVDRERAKRAGAPTLLHAVPESFKRDRKPERRNGTPHDGIAPLHTGANDASEARLTSQAFLDWRDAG